MPLTMTEEQEREIRADAAKFYDADRKGGDPAEWPEALRVRQYPEVVRG